MSVEILRRAADLMRKRAKAATNAEWWPYFCPESKGSTEGDWIVDSAPAFICSTHGDAERSKADAEHIASWHPAVAVAVADWLDEAADHLEAHRDMDALPDGATCPTAREGLECSVLVQALTVARAYLGDQP